MRRKSSEPMRSIYLKMPESLMLKIELLHWDPRHQRMKYGALSALIERLLREYVAEKEVFKDDSE